MASPLLSAWSWPYCTVTVEDVGGLLTPPEIVVVLGRLKNRPAPPRRMIRCVPRTSYASPNRGPNSRTGHLYVAFGTPLWPGRNRPSVRFPAFGTSVPIAELELGPRNSPVSGFIAWRALPLHGYTLFAHPATNRTGAAASVHWSGRKFDACPSSSYCAC